MESITEEAKTLVWGEPSFVKKGRSTYMVADLPVRSALINDADELVECNVDVRRKGSEFAGKPWPLGSNDEISMRRTDRVDILHSANLFGSRR